MRDDANVTSLAPNDNVGKHGRSNHVTRRASERAKPERRKHNPRSCNQVKWERRFLVRNSDECMLSVQDVITADPTTSNSSRCTQNTAKNQKKLFGKLPVTDKQYKQRKNARFYPNPNPPVPIRVSTKSKRSNATVWSTITKKPTASHSAKKQNQNQATTLWCYSRAVKCSGFKRKQTKHFFSRFACYKGLTKSNSAYLQLLTTNAVAIGLSRL